MDAPAPILNVPSSENNANIIINQSASSLPELKELGTKGNINNVIKMKLIIKKEDVDKPTKILYRINRRIAGCDLNELNDSNTELFINGKQYKYKSYFTPEKEGIVDIQLNIKILMKNCCCLFSGLNLQSLDLSSFNTQNVTNMSYMFYNCKSLTNLNLANFNTQNVTNMSYMFYLCLSLQNIILTSFNTQKVINMESMFNYCNNLKSLNLSSFNTQNVTNMTELFRECQSLEILDLSSFNTKNLQKVNYIFFGCDSLQRVIISYKAPKISKLISSYKIFYA